jgi:hypothetical protein
MKPFDVEITTGEQDNSADLNYVTVWALWEGVDRPKSHGIQVRKTVAPRLKRAILAGAVFTNPQITKDVNGKTYVQANCKVMARYANADLKKLGY